MNGSLRGSVLVLLEPSGYIFPGRTVVFPASICMRRVKWLIITLQDLAFGALLYLQGLQVKVNVLCGSLRLNSVMCLRFLSPASKESGI